MKYTLSILLITVMTIGSGCSKNDRRAGEKDPDPAFMFWCFRKEVVTAEYHIPELETSAGATYLQNRIKGIPGYVENSCNLATHTMTIHFQSSTVRKMNFEEAIAMAGFSVNNRPAYPNVKIPAGVK